jgi:hypothetical protein
VANVSLGALDFCFWVPALWEAHSVERRGLFFVQHDQNRDELFPVDGAGPISDHDPSRDLDSKLDLADCGSGYDKGCCA